MRLTDCHAKYLACELTRRCQSHSTDKLARELAQSATGTAQDRKRGEIDLPDCKSMNTEITPFSKNKACRAMEKLRQLLLMTTSTSSQYMYPKLHAIRHQYIDNHTHRNRQ